MDLRNRIPIGVWAILPEFGAAEMERLADVSEEEFKLMSRMFGDDDRATKKRYTVNNGVAVVPVQGTLMRDPMCDGYGSTSTTMLKHTLRAAERDPLVTKNILVKANSPGGHVDGIYDVAEEVGRIARSGNKKIIVSVEDTAASAMYWIASQANEIYAGPTSAVGSLGAYTIIDDRSKEFADRGVVRHVIGEGEFKGMGAPGTVVTDVQIAKIKERVVAMTQPFKDSVAKGRKFSPEKAADLFTGECWIGKDAQAVGLIDGVKTFDEVLTSLGGDPTADLNENGRTRYMAENGIEAKIRAILEGAEQGSDPSPPPAPAPPVQTDKAWSELRRHMVSAGIVDVQSFQKLQRTAALGEAYGEKIKSQSLLAATRNFGDQGADKVQAIVAGLAGLEPADVMAIVEGWDKAADAKYGIGQGAGGGAQRATAPAPAATSENAEGATPPATGDGSGNANANADTPFTPERRKQLLRMSSVGDRVLAKEGK